MTDLEKLAQRVEALTGPCREMDAEITVALRRHHPAGLWSLNFPEWEPDYTDKGRVWAVGNINGNGSHRSGSWISEFYTASIDEALTLVPKGLVYNLGNETAFCWANVWDDTPDYDGEPYEGHASTLPCAIVAACLRAQSKGN